MLPCHKILTQFFVALDTIKAIFVYKATIDYQSQEIMVQV